MRTLDRLLGVLRDLDSNAPIDALNALRVGRLGADFQSVEQEVREAEAAAVRAAVEIGAARSALTMACGRLIVDERGMPGQTGEPHQLVGGPRSVSALQGRADSAGTP